MNGLIVAVAVFYILLGLVHFFKLMTGRLNGATGALGPAGEKGEPGTCRCPEGRVRVDGTPYVPQPGGSDDC